MARNLGRLFSSSVISLSRSESLTRPASNSAIRLMCSSTQQTQLHNQASPSKERVEAMEENLQKQNKAEEEDEDDAHVNKETGEVGGPRGPEPTRYGDWERNGRCSDF